MSPQVADGPAKPTVVIVDDDPAVRGALAFSLETEGFLVRSYANGADLLVDSPVSDESCLVIDYQLPGMNGLDLLVELRRRCVAAPAILVTTHPSAVVRERAVANGMALVEKPLLGDALSTEICAAFAKINRSISLQLIECRRDGVANAIAALAQHLDPP